VGLAVHGEAAKREKKTNFYANKSVDGMQLGEYLADFGKWGPILIVTSCLTLSMLYFTSGGHFLDLLRCSKVRQLKVAIVTLRSDQQGDTVVDGSVQIKFFIFRLLECMNSSNIQIHLYYEFIYCLQ
jgi:hypothetical protein